eukprot:1300932-Pyramimonas_sp.AAC.1
MAIRQHVRAHAPKAGPPHPRHLGSAGLFGISRNSCKSSGFDTWEVLGFPKMPSQESGTWSDNGSLGISRIALQVLSIWQLVGPRGIPRIPEEALLGIRKL